MRTVAAPGPRTPSLGALLLACKKELFCSVKSWKRFVRRHEVATALSASAHLAQAQAAVGLLSAGEILERQRRAVFAKVALRRLRLKVLG